MDLTHLIELLDAYPVVALGSILAMCAVLVWQWAR
jgi:hypothetical protein